MFQTLGKYREKILLFIFLLVPFISSVISTFHIVDFVGLGNTKIMSVALAITFEMGALVSFITISKDILKKLKKGFIFTIFIILFILQSTGNIYSSFDYMRHMLSINPKWLDTFMEMTFNTMDATTAKFVLSVTIGLPIPLISLILLKSAVDYMYVDDAKPTEVPFVDNSGPKAQAPIMQAFKPLSMYPEPVHELAPEPAAESVSEPVIKEEPVVKEEPAPTPQNIIEELKEVSSEPISNAMEPAADESKTEEIPLNDDSFIEISRNKHGDKIEHDIVFKQRPKAKTKNKDIEGLPHELQSEIDKYNSKAPKTPWANNQE